MTLSLLLSLSLLAACGSNGDDGEPSGGSGPSGPSADVSEELSGGNGVFLPSVGVAAALAAAGYVEHEYLARGTATSYTAASSLPADGRFDLKEADAADYRTRVLVRRPLSSQRF